MPKPDLSLREREFVSNFVTLREGAEAARKAGYAHAKQAAYKLLQRPSIQAAIRRHEENDERLRGEVGRKIRNDLWEIVRAGKAFEPIENKAGKRVGRRMVDSTAALGALKELAKIENQYPREGLDIRVQGEVEKTLEGVKALVSPQAYAEFVRALAEITGVDRVDPEAAQGDGSGAVH